MASAWLGSCRLFRDRAISVAVLAHHYGSNMPGEPLTKNGVPNHGDFTTLIDDPPDCDILVGGTPCQAFSIAGSGSRLPMIAVIYHSHM